MKTLTIGKVARQAEVGIETVRFYEREGLLHKPDRKPSGYRQYDVATIDRLRFIKRAKWLGFSLQEIKGLLGLRLNPGATRADVRNRAEAKMADIDARIKELKRMKKALLKLTKACDGHGTVEGCPIIEALEGRMNC
jgi:Hg(II)-responsive transcriptional regulator